MSGQERFGNVVDVWSLAHIFWGAVCGATVWVLTPLASFLIALGVAVLNELFETTALGIWVCGFLEPGYSGDFLVNSVADVNFNLLGWNAVLCVYDVWFARLLPVWVVFILILMITDGTR